MCFGGVLAVLCIRSANSPSSSALVCSFSDQQKESSTEPQHYQRSPHVLPRSIERIRIAETQVAVCVIQQMSLGIPSR